MSRWFREGRAPVLAVVLGAAVAACGRPSGGEAAAVWEPIDQDFKGCEGG